MTADSVGPYHLIEPLREGKASSVYRVSAPAGGEPLALKVFSPELLENPTAVARLHREVAAVADLSHPNILRVVGSGQDGDRVYLATELFDGVALELLLRGRRLAPAEAIAVLKGICRGLAYAHQRGIVHGHLSPRHVLVSADLARVKLADFGPGEAEALSGLDATLSTGAINLGAFHYLAPEQTAGGGVRPAPDARADLYAAGVIFYEVLTGRTPAGRFTLPSQTSAHLPPETDVVVLKCLAREPEKRYQQAAALLADLARLEEGLKVKLLSDLRGFSRRFNGRRGWLAVCAGLLVIAAAVAALLLLR